MGFGGTIQAIAGRLGPWFINNKNLSTFKQALGLTYDAAIYELSQGLRLSQPLRCDESALPVLSRDRSIRIYPTEPVDSQRIRLAQWLPLHRTRGTHIGELKHSQPYFLPDTPVMRIVHQDGAGASATWHTIGADGSYSLHRATPSNWNYDGQTSKWSRWWVITYIPAALLNLAHYDDGSAYDSGLIYYDGVRTQVARDLVAMMLEWQSAHSRMQAYILATDPASFDPTSTSTTSPDGWTSLPVGNWGSPISSGGVRTRPPSALWIYEV